MHGHIDERESSLSIAFPSPFMFARRVIDPRSEGIGQHLFPFLVILSNRVFRPASAVNPKLSSITVNPASAMTEMRRRPDASGLCKKLPPQEGVGNAARRPRSTHRRPSRCGILPLSNREISEEVR